MVVLLCVVVQESLSLIPSSFPFVVVVGIGEVLVVELVVLPDVVTLVVAADELVLTLVGELVVLVVLVAPVVLVVLVVLLVVLVVMLVVVLVLEVLEVSLASGNVAVELVTEVVEVELLINGSTSAKTSREIQQTNRMTRLVLTDKLW